MAPPLYRESEVAAVVLDLDVVAHVGRGSRRLCLPGESVVPRGRCAAVAVRRSVVPVDSALSSRYPV